MGGRLERLIFRTQQVLLWASYWLSRPFAGRRRASGTAWVVVGIEVAGNLYHVGQVLQPSITVSLGQVNRYYEHTYTYSFASPSRLWYVLRRIFVAPMLLGRLLHWADGFYYVGEAGFLIDHLDGREFEFRFLKGKKKRIVCSFLGTDIRSPKLLLEYARKHEIDVISTYDHVLFPERRSERWEQEKRRLAQAADRYADHIFNAPVDQMSYLERTTHPPLYFMPAERFRRNDEKFRRLDPVLIVHAPSSPFIKGTPIVRAAIKKLRVEGYRFEYIELQGVPNTVVMETLARAHIVLNEFYAFLPGQFGVEALVSHCALLTSADERIEPSLPPGANEAWIVTPYWQIYDNLKALLDDPARIKEYADRGYEWARVHCGYEAAGRKLRAIVQSPPGAP